MPKNYTLNNENNDGYESDYEDEAGIHYVPGKVIGEGYFAQARKLESQSGARAKVVLRPKKVSDINYDEIRAKYQFFKALYPTDGVELIEKRGTYRLVVPLIHGKPYQQLKITAQEEQINLFMSAVYALSNCHDRGYVVVDLTGNNIHYDPHTGKSYLIDGGLAVKENEPIKASVFRKCTEKEVAYYRQAWSFLAPECFSLHTVAAKKTMDVYCLGNTVSNVLLDPHSGLIALIRKCQSRVPKDRPTLENLEEQLRKIEANPDDTLTQLATARNEAIERLLAPINKALDDLWDKMMAVDELRRNTKGFAQVSELLNKLQENRTKYAIALSFKSSSNDSLDTDAFKRQCLIALNKAMPLLAQDLGWGDYLKNWVKFLANLGIETVGLGSCPTNFFPLARSDSMEVVESSHVLTIVNSY